MMNLKNEHACATIFDKIVETHERSYVIFVVFV